MENPKIRFKGFTKDWEQRKLGDMGSTFTGLSGKTKENFGHGDAQFITYMNVFSNPVANLEMTEAVEIDAKQNCVKKGDVFFTTSSETPEEVGMSCVMPENKDNIYLNSFCFGYRPTEKFDLDYLAYVLRADSFRQEMTFLAQGISRYNISKNKVMEVSIPIPNLEEQTMVGRYFSNLDHLITLHQRKCEQTKKLKKYMLQKMFPQNGEKIPKIRFDGFTYDWEQRKFGEITELKSASRVHKDEWTSNGVPFYRSSDVMTAINGTENEKAFISEELYEKLSKVSGKLEEGDILVTGGGSVGNPYIVPDNKPLYTKDADLLWIKNKGKFHPYFLYEFFFSPTFRNYLGSISHVGTIAHYTITQLSDTPISLPSFEEQKEVGEYFQSLDCLITLHQRQTDFYKKTSFYFISS